MKRLRVASGFFSLLGLSTACVLLAGPAHAQAFQIGQQVQFNICDNDQLPTTWRSGVVTGPAREGSGLVQIQVTENASQDYPQGHGIWNPEVRCVRPLTTTTAGATDVKPLGWFLGRWNLTIIAPTRDFIGRDGRGYRREEYGAQMGFVQINADQTFTWKVMPSDPPSAWKNGRWRPASPSEPGARIVLMGGEDGRDWVVHGSSSGGQDEVRLNDTQFGLERLGSRS